MYFLRVLLGFTDFRIKGKRTQSLINQLRTRIVLTNISSVSDDTLAFTCFYKDKKTVLNEIRKLNLEIDCLKDGGLFPFILTHKNRWAICASAAVFFVAIFISTFFVWEIRVEGNEYVSQKDIERVLYEIGFREGILKKKVDLDSLVNNFLLRESRISWIAVNFDGTVAHVEVKEAATNKKIEKKENVNLVASHSGIIIRADALSGTTHVNKGDAVVKGQMLVSAYMPKKTGGEMLRGALGFVWAQTQREFTVCVPLTYTTKVYTGKTNSKYTLCVLGKDIPVYLSLNKKMNLCDFSSDTKRIKIAKNKVFPFEIKSEKYKEYKLYTKRRTLKQAKDIARNMVQNSINEKTKNYTVVEIKEEFTTEGNNLVLNCKIDAIENIAKELEFELS